ncbi:hypothetical protein [Ottowia sp.]|uniref:hypothetical protein n=1 Tax=Ottowia sp. TaxID=1898956 RepID=UPI003A83EDB0
MSAPHQQAEQAPFGSATQHTPGPWVTEGEVMSCGLRQALVVARTPGGPVFVATALPGLPGTAANARLITAAPDLLDALRDLLAAADMTYGWTPMQIEPLMGQARAAIAKALGAH